MAAANPVRMAAPLPWFCWWVMTRTVESSRAPRTFSDPSLDPSSTTISCRTRGISTARMRRTISATVARSLKTGMMTDSVAIGGPVRGRCLVGHVVVRRASTVRLPPPGGQGTQWCARCRRAARSSGFQPSSVMARVMSGQRRVGSSIGRGKVTMGECEPDTSSTRCGQLERRCARRDCRC